MRSFTCTGEVHNGAIVIFLIVMMATGILFYICQNSKNNTNMKKYFILPVLTLALAAGFSSCSKDDDDDNRSTPPPSNPAPTAVMTAKVDNVNWSSLSNRASGSIISGTSNLTGVANDSSMITMTITQNITVGTYGLGPSSGNAGVFATSTSGSAPAWSSNGNPACYGTLTVTSMDQTNKRFSGTFSFKAWRATDNTFREITNGVFTDVPYVTSISGGGSNTFTIKIDGVTFTPAVVSGSVALGNLTIVASDSQGSKSVGLTMPATVTPGTYSMTSFGTYYGQYNPNSSTYTMSNSGTLTITAHNTSAKTISGTCSFVSTPFGQSTPTFNLTNGAFSITY